MGAIVDFSTWPTVQANCNLAVIPDELLQFINFSGFDVDQTAEYNIWLWYECRLNIV